MIRFRNASLRWGLGSYHRFNTRGNQEREFDLLLLCSRIIQILQQIQISWHFIQLFYYHDSSKTPGMILHNIGLGFTVCIWNIMSNRVPIILNYRVLNPILIRANFEQNPIFIRTNFQIRINIPTWSATREISAYLAVSSHSLQCSIWISPDRKTAP